MTLRFPETKKLYGIVNVYGSGNPVYEGKTSPKDEARNLRPSGYRAADKAMQLTKLILPFIEGTWLNA